MLINKNALKTVINSLLMKINSKADKTDIIQSDWNQNDKTSSDYVKNRTHYDSRIFGSKTYTFDGNIEGKETVQPTESNFYVKLSDDDISIADMVGGTIVLYDNGVTFEEIILGEPDEATESVYFFNPLPLMIVLNDTEFGGTSLTKGIWVGCNLDGDTPVYYVSELNYNTVSGELHKLDNKYLDIDRVGAYGTGQGAEIFNEYEGENTASGEYSHAEGYYTTASGERSHAEGYHTTASGNRSHAEGDHTIASGGCSHAEGYSTTASGSYSHAEGAHTTALGRRSHAEGYYTDAYGDYSHAEGYYTYAACMYQHTQGTYNILDTAGDRLTKGTYAHIVGNGTWNGARSNAHTLDWDGNAWFAGDVYVGSTSGTNKDNGSVKLATENYVTNNEHTSNTTIHITAAERTAWNAKQDAISVLSVDKGGTGYNSITDTTYTTARYRASALVTTETNPTINGVINWIYE